MQPSTDSKPVTYELVEPVDSTPMLRQVLTTWLQSRTVPTGIVLSSDEIGERPSNTDTPTPTTRT